MLPASDRHAALWLVDLMRAACPSAVAHGYQCQVDWADRTAAARAVATLPDAAVTPASRLDARVQRHGHPLGFHLALVPSPARVIAEAAAAIIATDNWLRAGAMNGAYVADGIAGLAAAAHVMTLIRVVTVTAGQERAALPFGADAPLSPVSETLGRLLTDAAGAVADPAPLGTHEFEWYLARYTQVAVSDFRQDPSLLAVAYALEAEQRRPLTVLTRTAADQARSPS